MVNKLDKVTKVKTNHKKESVASVPYKRKVRLLLFGGAAEPSDNSAFEWAARGVIKDYKATDKTSIIEQHRIYTAQDIVSYINRQDEDSIRSLDVFTHGGMQALYLTTADRGTNAVVRWGLHNSSLYRSRVKMLLNAAGWTKGSALMGDIKFSKFADNAKVELHGCRTAGTESDDDNITADFSAQLAKAGKASAIVIGHANKANPNINGGGEDDDEQDYRHGPRVIFSKGKIVKVTRQKGHLVERDLDALAGK